MLAVTEAIYICVALQMPVKIRVRTLLSAP